MAEPEEQLGEEDPGAGGTPQDGVDALSPAFRKKDVRERVLSKLEAAKKKYAGWRKHNREPIWEIVDRALQGIPPLDNFPYFSSYADREIFRQVEVLKPIFADMVMPRDSEWFRYVSEDDEEKAANAATAIVQKHLRRNGLKPEIMKWATEHLVWGTSFMLYGWGQYKRISRKIRELHTKKDIWKSETSEFLQEGPYLEYVHHYSMYADPFIEDPRESPFVFVERVVSGSFLKTEVREGRYDAHLVSELLKTRKDGHAPGMGDIVPEGKLGEVEDLLNYIEDDAEYKESRCWSNNGWFYAYIDDSHMVAAHENPFGLAPILTLKNYPRPGELYGQGEPEVVIANFRHLHDVTSLWMDSVHFGNMPMFKGRRSESTNIRKIRFQPGAVALLDDMGSLEHFQTSPNVFSLSEIRGSIKNDMRMATGITDEVAGSGSEQRTATGVVRLQNAASTRIMHKVTLALPVLEDLYKILYDLEGEFLSESVRVRLAGPDGRLVSTRATPDVFEPSVDVEIEVGPGVTAREMRQQQFQILAQQWSQDPRVDFRPVFVRGMRDFGIPNPERMWASAAQTQNDVMAQIDKHRTSGTMQDAAAADNHMLWVQMLSMYTQTPEFQQMDPVSQQFAIARLQQHIAYLELQGQQSGDMAQSSPFAGGGGAQDEGEEAMGNMSAGGRLQGANANNAGAEAIESGGF